VKIWPGSAKGGRTWGGEKNMAVPSKWPRRDIQRRALGENNKGVERSKLQKNTVGGAQHAQRADAKKIRPQKLTVEKEKIVKIHFKKNKKLKNEGKPPGVKY